MTPVSDPGSQASPEPVPAAPIRTRSIGRRVTLIVAITTLGLLVLSYFILNVFVLRSFSTVEEADVRENVQRVLNALSDDLASLQRTAADYAVWDDTYKFMQEHDPAYLDVNYDPPTLTRNRFDVIALLGVDRQPIAARQLDAAKQATQDVPGELLSKLADTRQVLQHSEAQGGNGLIQTAAGPLLVAAWPILTSAETGPTNGTLLMGRWLDDNTVRQLADVTRLTFKLHTLNTTDVVTQRAIQQLSPTKPTVVEALNDREIAGYGLLVDVYGKPAAAVQITLPRTVYAQAQSSALYFMLTMLLAGLIFGAVILLLLRSALLSRLSRLNTQLATIGAQGDVSQRVQMDGHDELTSLSANINTMLASIERLSNKLESEQEEAGRLLLDTIPAELEGQNTLIDQPAATLLADITDATRATNRPEDETTFQVLEEIYRAFDGLLKEYHAEKIRTPGENYFALAGLTPEASAPAAIMVEVALAMQNLIDRANRDKNLSLQLRVGIHTGTLASGTIGTQHVTLDRWGETLAITTLVAGHCSPDEIEVTQTTYDELITNYHFEPSGVIYLRRSQQAINTYRLLGRKPPATGRLR